jgi:antitoxin (DNA-binding transcriptional repressor) of toxin-antitoxin stability system
MPPKPHLSRLIEKARSGEEIIIAKGSEPVAKLVPLTAEPKGRAFGAMKGRATVDDAFFEPLPEEELRAWES